MKSRPIRGFMRGINIGNALDAPAEVNWAIPLTSEHFQMAAAAGLDHIRLPVRFSAYADRAAPYAIAEGFLRRIDWAVEQALANGLSLLLDLHHYDELMQSPNQHSARFVGIWRQIAAHYAGAPPSLAFELLNEPCHQLVPDLWNPLAAKTIEAIRAHDRSRLIFVDSCSWANLASLDKLELPDDPNVVASFHMYEPVLFTHQGASWMNAEYQTRGVVFPGPPEKRVVPTQAALDTPWARAWFEAYNLQPNEENPCSRSNVVERFSAADRYVERTGRRLYLGEFAAIDHADRNSRASWVRLIRKEAERRQIGWAYWDDGSKTQAMDVKRGSWVPFLKSALLR